MRRTFDWLLTATLALAGVLGVLISVADLVGMDISVLTTKEPDAILLLMLALISTSIALERAMVTQRLARTLENVEDVVSRSPGMKRVDGKDAIYKSGIRLVGTAERRIRSILIADANKVPAGFAQAAAARLKELDRKGTPARLDVVLVLDRRGTAEDIPDFIRARHQQYVDRGVGDLVSVHILDQGHPVGMDYLIIDRRHVTVALAPTAGSEKLMTALVFEDQREVADQFADWFDQKVLPRAKKVI